VENLPREYRPELIARRGEAIAWLLFVVVSAPWLHRWHHANGIAHRRLETAWLAAKLLKMQVTWLVPVFAFLLLFAAGSISLGNWIDRCTALFLDKDGVTFQNGLRNVRLTWNQIKEVRVLPATWNKRVSVIGERAHFDLNTLGEVKYQGATKG